MDSNDPAASTLRVTSAELSKYTKVEKGGIAGQTKPYSLNTMSICGTIAIAIVLRYYFEYESSKYIPILCDSREKTIKLSLIKETEYVQRKK